MQGTDENGDAAGFFHAYINGQIVYTPGVGPVICRERVMSSGFETERIATLQERGLATWMTQSSFPLIHGSYLHE